MTREGSYDKDFLLIEEYKLLVSMQIGESNRFWTRFNLSLAINGGLIVVLSVVVSSAEMISGIIPIMMGIGITGVTASVIWFLQTGSGAGWQAYWIAKARHIETQHGVFDIYNDMKEFRGKQIPYYQRSGITKLSLGIPLIMAILWGGLIPFSLTNGTINFLHDIWQTYLIIGFVGATLTIVYLAQTNPEEPEPWAQCIYCQEITVVGKPEDNSNLKTPVPTKTDDGIRVPKVASRSFKKNFGILSVIITLVFSMTNLAGNQFPNFRYEAILSINFMILSFIIPWGISAVLGGISLSTRLRSDRQISRLWNRLLDLAGSTANVAYDLAGPISIALLIIYSIIVGGEVTQLLPEFGKTTDELLVAFLNLLSIPPNTTVAFILFAGLITLISAIYGTAKSR